MRALVITLTVLTAVAAHGGGFGGDCQEFAERSVVESATGVTRVVIIGRAGFLHVEGRTGAVEIRATGRACAPIEELLVGIRLSARRSGSQLTIEAMVPDQKSSLLASAPRLDFTVGLPAGLEVDVADTSGELTISGVGNTRVAGTSARINVRRISGNLTVRDASGGMDLADVSGNVHVPSESSGSIRIGHVDGSVTIDEDGSGSIDIRNVKRNVAIASGGTGALEVSDIGGDFRLRTKTRGSVDYHRVSGRVTVPDRYRR